MEQAGITVNGQQPWDIRIHDERWYRRVLLEKNIGLGESDMDGPPFTRGTRKGC